MIPFEVVVVGVPVSAQARRRERVRQYRGEVRASVETQWPSGHAPATGELAVSIVYFYDGSAPDVDNIQKPILDGLKGVVYRDDEQVVRVECEKKDLNASYIVRGISPVLAEGFVSGEDFVFVQVRRPANREALP